MSYFSCYKFIISFIEKEEPINLTIETNTEQ